jgi:hypothetical protein
MESFVLAATFKYYWLPFAHPPRSTSARWR